MRSDDTSCPQETAILYQMSDAHKRGDKIWFANLENQLMQHRRACPVCNGSAVKQFFAKTGKQVIVREYIPILNGVKNDH